MGGGGDRLEKSMVEESMHGESLTCCVSPCSERAKFTHMFLWDGEKES